jgi:hypothetical protein
VATIVISGRGSAGQVPDVDLHDTPVIDQQDMIVWRQDCVRSPAAVLDDL